MLQLLTILWKACVFVFLCLLTFYLLDRSAIAFLSWYIAVPVIRQLAAFFILGSLVWMTGRGLNYGLILLGTRLRIKRMLVIVMLAGCWMIHTAALCIAFRPLAARGSVVGLPTAILLAAEVSVYPLYMLRRELTYSSDAKSGLN